MVPISDVRLWLDYFLYGGQKGIYLRIDQDILDRLKAKGPGYQTRINATLRAYLVHNQGHEPGSLTG